MKRALIVAGSVAAAFASIALAAPGGAAGPSSSADPYVVRSEPEVVLKSIVTVGDSVPRAGWHVPDGGDSGRPRRV
jgi:hypothetical protein